LIFEVVKTGSVVYPVHVFYFINHQSAISTTQLQNSHVFAVGYEFNEVSFLANSLVDFPEINQCDFVRSLMWLDKHSAPVG
jgi:hypothetical protein